MYLSRVICLLFVILGLTASAVSAQWSTVGANVVWTQDDVGIGTPSPITGLHIVDDLNFSGAGGILLQTETAPAPGGQVLVFRMHHQGPNLPSGGESWSFEIPGNSPGRNGDLQLRQVNAEFSTARMTVKTNGNVGIGTPDPLTPFHVVGDARFDGNVAVNGDLTGNRAGGALRIRTQFGVTDIGMQNAGFSHFGTSASRFWFGKPVWFNSAISSHNNRDLILQTAGTTRLTVDRSSGFVGIGTTNPQSLLAVNGKITAREVEVTATGWADYVFADDYDLMPLETVAEHIETEGHLPGIPSEEEVMAEGVDLGAMQVKLLEKVEELTLYMIDLKSENEMLEARLASLEDTRSGS